MSSSDVARYFNKVADDFDEIYRRSPSRLRRVRDAVTRQTVRERLVFVRELVAHHKATRVLDIGCGSGRFGIALAGDGVHVVGIDFAPEMIELAGQLAHEAGTDSWTSFVTADFESWAATTDARFDISIAMGVADYVEEPTHLLASAAKLATSAVSISFPKRFHVLSPLRWLRLRAAGCPVYFYRRSDVRRIAQSAGLEAITITSFRRDFLLVAKTTPG